MENQVPFSLIVKERVIDERCVDSLFLCPLIFVAMQDCTRIGCLHGAKLPWRFVICFCLFSIAGVVGYKQCSA